MPTVRQGVNAARCSAAETNKASGSERSCLRTMVQRQLELLATRDPKGRRTAAAVQKQCFRAFNRWHVPYYTSRKEKPRAPYARIKYDTRILSCLMLFVEAGPRYLLRAATQTAILVRKDAYKYVEGRSFGVRQGLFSILALTY